MKKIARRGDRRYSSKAPKGYVSLLQQLHGEPVDAPERERQRLEHEFRVARAREIRA